MRLGVATDHGGFALKEDLVARPRSASHEDDYPNHIFPLARAVAKGAVERGVVPGGPG
jgi:ribose 5-phosphate isomerase B